MPIISYTGGYVSTNGYVVDHEGTCVVIDAPALIHDMIETEGLKPTHLLLTHQHFDHTEDVEALQKLGIKIVAHSAYDESLIRQKEARENWRLPINITPFTPDILLENKIEFHIDGLHFKVSHVPGHSPDSITFYNEDLGVIFSGDTLMAGGMGRTDLPGGSEEQLVTGIKEHIYSLPTETIVLSGHGDATSVGVEIEENDFI